MLSELSEDLSQCKGLGKSTVFSYVPIKKLPSGDGPQGVVLGMMRVLTDVMIVTGR